MTSTAGDCTDASLPLHYEVTDNGINRAKIAIDVDSQSNMINLTPMLDGSANIDLQLVI